MADVKLMVMYPRPQDVETFDHLYQDEDGRPAMGSRPNMSVASWHSRSSIRRSTCR